uniref:Uncharacterized protein n=1 Tax=Caenorhabditis japonica TaxID=281687 RepID=A0A8R1E6M7_CAEJA
MTTGIVPKKWRQSIVFPLQKVSSSSEVSHFRPISLTSVFCRTYEKFLLKKVQNFLSDTKFWAASQIAYTTSVLTPISSSLRRWKNTTAITSTTSRMPSQSTFPSAAVSATKDFGNMFHEQAARQHRPLLRRRKE